MAVLTGICLAGCGAENISLPKESAAAPELQILFINVGKADSALITYANRHYLVDTGSAESLPNVVKALRLKNIDTIDGIFLSHTHADHIGGLEGLLNLFNVRQIYASEITTSDKDGVNVVDEIAAEAGKTVKRLACGDQVVLYPAYPGVKFLVAGPVEPNLDDDNDNSLVLYLEDGPFSCLFTGDMQVSEENSLIDAGTLHSCTVLKVGNHGNADASSQAFIQTVSPEYAVISTDSTIDQDTPSAKVLGVLKEAGAQVYVTQQAGTGIRVEVAVNGITVKNDAAVLSSVTTGVEIESADRESGLVVLRNAGSEAVDLTGWWILSARSGEMFFFPDQERVPPGGTLSIAGGKHQPDADLYWDSDATWNGKKTDTLLIYDAMGDEVGSADFK